MPWEGVTVNEDTPEVPAGAQARVLLRLRPGRSLLHLPPDSPQVDPPPQALRRERLPRALPPPLQLPLPDRSRHHPGARRPAQGPPLLGRPQAPRPHAPPAALPAAPITLHRLPHSPPRRPCPLQTPLPPRPPRVPQSPSPTVPTTSGPSTTRASSASRTPTTASPSPSPISPPATSWASTPTPPSPCELTQKHFTRLFHEFGLPNRIRSDNGVPFASSALARLSALSVWFIKLGIYPELIQPGKPQQNGIHERMHRTLKREATIPPASTLPAQQRRFDAFRQEFNELRPHEALAMQRPAQLYRPSTRAMPTTPRALRLPLPLPGPPRQPRRHHPRAPQPDLRLQHPAR